MLDADDGVGAVVCGGGGWLGVCVGGLSQWMRIG